MFICSAVLFKYHKISFQAERIAFFLFSLFVFTPLLFLSCQSSSSSFPPVLKKAIELFYIENENDSILSLLDNDKTLDKNYWEMKQLLRAAAWCEKGDVDTAAFILESIESKANCKISIFWRSHITGLVLFRQNKSAEAYETLLKAVSGKCFDIRANALSERLIARIMLIYGTHKDIVGWMLKSSENFSEAGLEKSIGINDKILGRYYMNVGNLQEAFKNFTKSENTLRQFNDIAELYYIYINWVDYYITINNLQKAEEYANKCLEILEGYNENQMKTLIYNNMGEILLKQNKPDEAESYFLLSVNMPLNYVSANIRVGNALVFLSKISARRNNKEQALEYAMRARQLFSSPESYMVPKHKIFNQLAEVHQQFNNKKLAAAYRDSAEVCWQVITNEKTSLTKEIYDVKADLLQSTKAIEELNIKTKNRSILLLVISIALLITGTALFILYRTSKAKAESLRMLAKKNLELLEEERKESEKLRKTPASKQNSSRATIENGKSQILFTQLNQWLQENENFKRNDLNIETVSNCLNTNREYLSKAINANGHTFTDLINKIRINKAMEILSNPNHALYNQKIANLSSEIGFNSESVFFSAFKKTNRNDSGTISQRLPLDPKILKRSFQTNKSTSD